LAHQSKIEELSENLLGRLILPANEERISEWAKAHWPVLHPHSAGASCINFMIEEGRERIQATYFENCERLQRIKDECDPGNFFHVN